MRHRRCDRLGASSSSWQLVCCCLGVGAALLAMAGCPGDEAADERYDTCPNGAPAAGERCASPGLGCTYADPVACETGTFGAACGADGHWVLDRTGCLDVVLGCGGHGGCGGGGAVGGGLSGGSAGHGG